MMNNGFANGGGFTKNGENLLKFGAFCDIIVHVLF